MNINPNQPNTKNKSDLAAYWRQRVTNARKSGNDAELEEAKAGPAQTLSTPASLLRTPRAKKVSTK